MLQMTVASLVNINLSANVITKYSAGLILNILTELSLLEVIGVDDKYLKH